MTTPTRQPSTATPSERCVPEYLEVDLGQTECNTSNLFFSSLILFCNVALDRCLLRHLACRIVVSSSDELSRCQVYRSPWYRQNAENAWWLTRRRDFQISKSKDNGTDWENSAATTAKKILNCLVWKLYASYKGFWRKTISPMTPS